MRRTLEELIRHYSEAVDDAAPRVEELLPPEMAQHLGVARTEVTTTTRLRPLEKKRLTPGWAVGLAAALVVAVLSIPVILLTNADQQKLASTVHSIPPGSTSPSATTIAPVRGEPSLVFDRGSGRLSGTFWKPGATIVVSVGEIQRSAVVNSDGSFTTAESDLVKCCYNQLVVTDGTTTLRIDEVPDMKITRVDPQSDVIAGTSRDGPDVELRILGGGEPFETQAAPRDNGWFADLSGLFDLIPGMVVEARAVFPEITVTDQSTDRIDPRSVLKLATNEIVGDSFAPQAPVSITVDKFELRVATNAQGAFAVPLGDRGIELLANQVLSITDGISTLEATVPVLTYDRFDAELGVSSGTTDLPDGTRLFVELWMSDDGSDEPNQYATYEAVVSNSAWSLSFDPLPGDWTVIATDVGADLENGFGVETVIEPD